MGITHPYAAWSRKNVYATANRASKNRKCTSVVRGFFVFNARIAFFSVDKKINKNSKALRDAQCPYSRDIDYSEIFHR